MHRRVTTGLIAMALAACGDPLKEAQRLEEPRVLGVRFATADDRSSLEPGEPALLEVLLAGPDGLPPGARFAFELCEAAASERGVPYCAGETLAAGVVDLDGTAIPIDVPVSATPGAALALLGTACLTGEPELAEDPVDWTCSDGSEPLRLSFDAHVSSEDVVNQNPDLSELTIRAGGVELPVEAATAAPDCATSTVLSAQQASTLELTLGEVAREPASPATAAESLQLSHVSSRGLLARHYSFVAPDETPTVSVGFAAPRGGGAVKQYLVVRDGRGGVSWATFSFCVE